MSIQITIENNGHRHMQQLVLRMGAWIKIFPGDQYKWMMAKALNACVYNDETLPARAFRLDVTGYLFYGKEAYLLLRIQKKELPRMLQYFSMQLRHEMAAELKRVIRLNGNAAAKRILRRLEYEEVKLFRQYPLVNETLVRMITGGEAGATYSDPLKERAKEMIHANVFCSAIDYAGGEGPVVVAKKWVLHIE